MADPNNYNEYQWVGGRAYRVYYVPNPIATTACYNGESISPPTTTPHMPMFKKGDIIKTSYDISGRCLNRSAWTLDHREQYVVLQTPDICQYSGYRAYKLEVFKSAPGCDDDGQEVYVKESNVDPNFTLIMGESVSGLYFPLLSHV